MGYLKNNEITVDAILTKKGRELLAKGQDNFNISFFALADDEIDYSLFNPDHPLGTEFYGSIIENMPITEAVPDETQNMRFKLVTLPKKAVRIPQVVVQNNSITLDSGQSATIIPDTPNYQDGNKSYGYTAVLSDSDAVLISVEETAIGTDMIVPAPAGIFDSNTSVRLIGKSFKITAKPQLTAAKTCTITVHGNETGGQTIVNVTVRQQPANFNAGLTS